MKKLIWLLITTLSTGTAIGTAVIVKNVTSHEHDYIAETYEATCEETGYVKYTCQECGDTYTETIQPTGHIYGEWIITNEPTCTNNGKKAKICKNDNKHIIYENIPSLGHSPEPAVSENIIEPTCTQSGSYDLVVYCSVCGDELSRTTKVLNPLEHSPEPAVTENRKEPTCTQSGSYD